MVPAALKDTGTFMGGGKMTAGECNPFLSTPSSATFLRTLLVAFLLMTFNVHEVVVQAAASASASAAAAAAGAGGAGTGTGGIDRRPPDLDRPADGLKKHHYGITSTSSAQHHVGGTSTAASSSSSASAAALVSGGGSPGLSTGGPGAGTGAGGTEKPYFDDVNSRNVTTVVDDTAVLKCRVKHKGDRTVSWMRKRDLHILTSNIYTYTGDQRFSVIHPPDSDDWDLKIEYAQQKDSGIYECQVNTEPKINLAVYLDVTDEREFAQDFSKYGPSSGGKHFNGVGGGLDFLSTAARAKIIGSQEVHVKKGSTISLSCVVNVHASSISWYHGSSIVDFDSARGGISLETEKTEGGTSSRLMLTRATLRDSGNYTCVPTGAISASVQVHVLNGEHPAAMQTSSGVPCPTHQALILLFVSLNSCNLSKLIYFISNLLVAARFLLAASTTTLLLHLRRLANLGKRQPEAALLASPIWHRAIRFEPSSEFGALGPLRPAAPIVPSDPDQSRAQRR
ncbi:homeotic protein female sterile [Anopheles bellator]|uniref:homeotic protein female sterile n=1 Tax=Anopheles bellator TaxID=139047 RepID=UPI0026484C50|nr:homeotic protein female sterile [Anopheles bellator]